MEKGKVLIFAFASGLMILSFPCVCSGEVPYDVIVVRADIPTDYVVASIYAGAQNVPLVLVDPDSIEAESKSELSGYRGAGNQLLLIIGGESAISGNVENELKDMGYIVNRLWDWNRYGTAARVSIDLWGESPEAVIANGEDYSVFLTAQRLALEKHIPILFSTNATLPSETRDALISLGTHKAFLVGLDGSTGSELSGMRISVERIEGKSGEPAGGEEGEAAGSAGLLIAALSAAALTASVAILFLSSRKRRASVLVMTEDEEKIIEILRMHGRTEQNKLTAFTGFSKPRISRMLTDMEKRGIIEREKFKKTLRVKLRHKLAFKD
jgi:putative cell wall-binding protein